MVHSSKAAHLPDQLYIKEVDERIRQLQQETEINTASTALQLKKQLYNQLVKIF